MKTVAKNINAGKPERTVSEIMADVQKADYGKECRKLHKELKRVTGGGLPLFMRYPNLPSIVSIVAIGIAALALLLIFETLIRL